MINTTGYSYFTLKTIAHCYRYGGPSSTERRVILWSFVNSRSLATRSTPAENKLSCAARSVLVTHIKHPLDTIPMAPGLPNSNSSYPTFPAPPYPLRNSLCHHWHDFSFRIDWGFWAVSVFHRSGGCQTRPQRATTYDKFILRGSIRLLNY